MPDPLPASRFTPRVWLVVVALTVLAALMLVSMLLLAVLLTAQTQALSQSVEQSQNVINSNLRTLSQAQREILRMVTVIEDQTATAEEINLQRGFISQRTQEASLSYQVYTLGSEGLLQVSRGLRDQWLASVEPLIVEIMANPQAATSEQRAAVISGLEQLERGYNQLVADGEANRRLQGAALNASARETLGTTTFVLIALAISALAFIALGALATINFARLTRQREAVNRALLRANAELRNLSAVASRTKNPVLITNADGRIEWVNDAFLAKTGYRLDEVRGSMPANLLHGPKSDPAVIAGMRDRLRAHQEVEAEIVNYRKDGSEYWVKVEAQPIFDELGEFTNTISVHTDITERMQTEQALRTALDQERDLREMKSRFISMTSHEFRTPLTTVLSVASFLKMADSRLTSEQRVERLSKIEIAARHISTLIDDVLLYDQPDRAWARFAPQPVDAGALATALVDEIRAGGGARHQFALDVPTTPVILYSDPKLLRQVLSNLIMNAVKYSPQGSEVRVQVQPEGDSVALRVHDQGIGIPAADQKHLFEPFSRGSNTRGVAGTGLGLAIAHNAVELHGGSISVESSSAEGTTFTVVLPTRSAREDTP